MVLANPREACEPVKPLSSYNQSGYSGNWFLLIDVGDCDFDKKVCDVINMLLPHKKLLYVWKARVKGHLFYFFSFKMVSFGGLLVSFVAFSRELMYLTMAIVWY